MNLPSNDRSAPKCRQCGCSKERPSGLIVTFINQVYDNFSSFKCTIPCEHSDVEHKSFLLERFAETIIGQQGGNRSLKESSPRRYIIASVRLFMPYPTQAIRPVPRYGAKHCH